MTAWNNFVKKIYHEGHDSDPSYQFKQALKDASKRKSEMGSMNLASGVKKSKKSKRSSRKSKKCCKCPPKKGGTRKHRKH